MMYDAKTALVLGLGESGLAMALWLARSGACVRVADTREAPERLAALQAAVPQAQFIAGAFSAELLDGVDFVAVSPGLAPGRELAGIAPAAQEKNIPVWGEIELFAQALAALKAERGYAPKVIAITGTNGKTTVTSLVGLLCERAGLVTRVAGNISPAALDVLREVLDAEPAPQPVETDAEAAEPVAGTLPQAWILELSSFQLHTTFSLQADAATVLNLSQDHLDWHGDMAAYAKDKARIFGEQTVRILNRDDALVMHMADPLAETVTFGTGEPAEVDSFGLVNERGIFWLAQAVPSEEVIEKKRRKNDPAPEPVPTMAKKLMPADALKIRGQHNASNALAALALCRAIGLPFAPLLHGLREYQGEPHRVELITAVGEVEYYDDSKGTNVGATVAALSGLGKAFGGAEQRLVLIAGGDGKGQDFSPLAEPVSRYVRAVVLIGRDAPALRAALEPAGVDIIDCATLPEAVKRASSLALAGDAVLLSPACASLDMFKNYAHRAQVFVDAVRDIALENGQDI
ncbi:UDP-N-acetylmuramoylalanine--D-glutamate ligase [Janthinobacterium sp. HH103]|uniref:UDP-N-acetylmuramoylalanine--D-glutamate ligase n=1 Tax=Janthinobacterium agaricidamnosum TaxID=55508 RepID=A0A3G2E5T4_9BURK|nr:MULTISPECIES: UDP-N-acetylmuramoyl-L-alanine--D-glutamate ligase [Janthinobacterium]AYM74799.1 UDP-N-acetylmuramoyl-L-alanine--D-glutamate ligase [Janthinobacterium agaricidamnosum]OEZ67250.1 UDP-N-acetylmuramoylalanine--D-glutamate ligase [Janthinobacterium sp. HH100]OEZ71620.1 UDP-N-acetylmuramoylalanine--D-glutamate ligase [Janthinobacterium sp. HH103]OEZ94269.1 UDP-N-acetylmuramoylalanine--D-glutamate ligase [Janthinobacterium sp. HH107]QOU71774.1 UDP-N-acetylmuramoylalanine--D-glutamat